MKVENIKAINNLEPRQDLENKKTVIVKKDENIPAVVYEKSKKEDKGHVYDKTTIGKLKEDAEKSYANLKKIIQDMLARQGKAINLLNPEAVIEVDQSTRAEAQKLIDADGPLGVEAMSDKIVDFAKAISGGDKSKLEILKNAIDKGFREAEKKLGQLPEISQKTYDKIMEKLDAWENE